MNIFDYAAKNIPDILSEFGIDLTHGMHTKEANLRLQKFGPNRLHIKHVSGWHIFLRQFKSSFVILLFGAMGAAIVLGEMIDAAMIFIFLLINTGLGFYQEYSSEKTAQMLNAFALPRTHVLRNGKVKQITADQLVPGDVVFLKTGDRIPADVRLIEQRNFCVNESLLTGESAPVFKKTETLKRTPTSYHQAENMAFFGTDVVKGSAQAVVVATGKNTAFGKVAKLAGESKKVSDFEKRHYSLFPIYSQIGGSYADSGIYRSFTHQAERCKCF